MDRWVMFQDYRFRLFGQNSHRFLLISMQQEAVG
jgi:hypothetical protein